MTRVIRGWESSIKIQGYRRKEMNLNYRDRQKQKFIWSDADKSLA